MKTLNFFSFFLVLAFQMACSQSLDVDAENRENLFLKDYTKFPMGGSVNYDYLNVNVDYTKLCDTEFVSITPENHMKMGWLQPVRNRFDFTKADAIVKFATDRGIRVHGHTLVWHQTLPTWVKQFSGDQQAWEQILKEHIQTVVKHYKGKVASWDVVNEAFEDNGTLRKSVWSDNIPDYIAKSFQWAREADPDVLLFYSDYGQDRNTPLKSEAILAMITDLKKRNIPIDGYGLQSHLSTINSTNERIIKSIQDAAATGLKVHLSELDVSVNSNNVSTFTYNDAIKAKQTEMYKVVFETYRSIPTNQQYGITCWNVGDKDTWLRTSFNRPLEYPLLFDDNYKRKEVYYFLLSLMK